MEEQREEREIEWPEPRQDPDEEPVEPWAHHHRRYTEHEGWPGWDEIRERLSE